MVWSIPVGDSSEMVSRPAFERSKRRQRETRRAHLFRLVSQKEEPSQVLNRIDHHVSIQVRRRFDEEVVGSSSESSEGRCVCERDDQGEDIPGQSMREGGKLWRREKELNRFECEEEMVKRHELTSGTVEGGGK